MLENASHMVLTCANGGNKLARNKFLAQLIVITKDVLLHVKIHVIIHMHLQSKFSFECRYYLALCSFK